MLQMNRTVAPEHSRPAIKSIASSVAVFSVFSVLIIGVILGGISILMSMNSMAQSPLPTRVTGISSANVQISDLLVQEKVPLKSAREQAAEFVWESE